MSTRPLVALVATPKFKIEKKRDLRQFVFQHLYTLTKHFTVISTGRTYNEIVDLIEGRSGKIHPDEHALIGKELGKSGALTPSVLKKWCDSIRSHFEKRGNGIKGMIEIAHELIQGKLDAVIQFSVEDDTTVRAGSAVLRREANVHDVPIASDVHTAQTLVEFWKRKLEQGRDAASLFPKRKRINDHCEPLCGVNPDDVLALIAHNERKITMSQFVMEHAKHLRRFKFILATGHSGVLARQSLRACGWSEQDVERILLCKSGPEGGDVQIAAAVIQGLCTNVLFFQDPGTSHPHQADIRLFEQAVLEEGVSVRLATNSASARILFDALNREPDDDVDPMLLQDALLHSKKGGAVPGPLIPPRAKLRTRTAEAVVRRSAGR